jgi:hypothetical protein
MLLVADGFEPLTEEARQIRALEGTDLDADYDAWESKDWPGVRMTFPHGWRKEDLRLRFGAQREKGFPPEKYYFEPMSDWTIAQRANDYVPGLLTKFALSCLLDGYHQHLSASRDVAARRRSAFRPIRDLRRLRTLVRTEAFDIGSAASEVRALAQDKHAYEWQMIDLTYVRTVGGGHPRLIDSLRKGQVARAKQLDAESRLLLSSLATTADLTQTISNVRVQRLILFLTVVSVAIATTAVIVALNS